MKTSNTFLTKLFGIVTVWLLGISNSTGQVVFSDTIVDGSFEIVTDNGGDPYFSSPPWLKCGPFNTPDYQPNDLFDISLPPYHGNHFLSMVHKGQLDGESITQRINSIPGEKYFMIMYLASSPTYYREPDGRLTLLHVNAKYPWFRNACNGNDTLWTSPPITKNRWQRHIANFQLPDTASSIMMLQFKVMNVPGKDIGGNILVDSIAGPFRGSWPKPDLGPDYSLCEGDSVLLTLPENVLIASGDSIIYKWGNGSKETRRTIHQPGQYSMCSSWRGLSQCDTVHISFEEKPIISLPKDSLLCDGDTLTVTASVQRSGYSYYWSGGGTDSTRSFTNSQKAIVEATNGICTVVDSIINLFKNCESLIEFPNVFTPNGDGINDIFRPMKVVNIRSIQVNIYDRWGRSVSSLSSLDQGWDGVGANQKPLPEGVYFWAVQYQTQDLQIHTSRGNVSLVR